MRSGGLPFGDLPRDLLALWPPIMFPFELSHVASHDFVSVASQDFGPVADKDFVPVVSQDFP